MYYPYNNQNYQPYQERLYNSIDQIENAQRKLEKEYRQYLQPYHNNEQSPYINSNNKFANIGKNTLINPLPFNGTTSYQQHYQNNPIQAKSLNPQLYHLIVPKVPIYPKYSIKFQGESTYKADYTNSQNMDLVRMINSQKINRKAHWSEGRSPFYGNSSYKEQFRPFRVEPRQIYTPLTYQNQQKKVKFQGKTSYNDEFKGFKVQVPRGQRCDVDYLPVPFKNNINSGNHIYYDLQQNKFT